MSRIVLGIAALLLLGAITSGPALAAEPTEAEQRAACTGDVMRLCFAQIPSRARISECMMANRSSLSPRCRAVVDATIDARTRVRN